MMNRVFGAIQRRATSISSWRGFVNVLSDGVRLQATLLL
jgi:hypothetical protein